MATFLDVYKGRADCLRIAVVVGATSAKRQDVSVGVWELRKDRLIPILDSIRETMRDRTAKAYDYEELATICDETGIENRFFRLNPIVAEWIDQTEPVDRSVDYLLL
jgi:hypothetical protein